LRNYSRKSFLSSRTASDLFALVFEGIGGINNPGYLENKIS